MKKTKSIKSAAIGNLMLEQMNDKDGKIKDKIQGVNLKNQSYLYKSKQEESLILVRIFIAIVKNQEVNF